MALVVTGIRRNEIRELRCADIDLLEGVLRVRGTKTEEAQRSIALSPAFVSALEAQFQRTAFKGEGEFVLCHPECGTRYSEKLFAEFRTALAQAEITNCVRPFHDLRDTARTIEVASGSSQSPS